MNYDTFEKIVDLLLLFFIGFSGVLVLGIILVATVQYPVLLLCWIGGGFVVISALYPGWVTKMWKQKEYRE